MVIFRKTASTLAVTIIVFLTLSAAPTQAKAAQVKPRCDSVLFSKQVKPSTPSHLLLIESWTSKPSRVEVNSTNDSDWSFEKLISGKEFTFSFKQQDSLSQFVQHEPGAANSISSQPSEIELAYLQRNYRGGVAASFDERKRRRSDLEQIIETKDELIQHISEIIEKYGAIKFEKTLADVLKETAERTLQFLIAEGVKIEVFKNENGFLSALILTDGSHKLNRKADQIKRDYDGTQLRYNLNLGFKGRYASLEAQIIISESVLLGKDSMASVLGHELRHAKNSIDGIRDFGIAEGESGLPGNPYAYNNYQEFEEAETHSYSLRKLAQALLQKIKSEKLAAVEHFETELLELAKQATIVAERNIIITGLLDEALKQGIEAKIKDMLTKFTGESRNVATLELLYQDRLPFSYTFVIHDQEAKTTEQQMKYIKLKVDEMKRLNPNYSAQFHVTRKATELLASVNTVREKVAILKGIISITRPHFWDNGNFIKVRELDLIQRFNSVISDRWLRHSDLK